MAAAQRMPASALTLREWRSAAPMVTKKSPTVSSTSGAPRNPGPG
jgi:hypothetical protein